MKRILKTFSQKWPEYLLEILVITVGILGAFALNNWNEERKSNSSEKRFLINLKSEVMANRHSLENNIVRHKVIHDHVIRFMSLTGPDATPINQASFDSLVYSSIQLPSYEPVKGNIISAELDDLDADQLKALIANWNIAVENYQRSIRITYDLYYNFLYPELHQHYQMKNVNGEMNSFGLRSHFVGDQLKLLKNLNFENHLTMRAINAKLIYNRALEIQKLEKRILEEIDKKLNEL
jgi:hypothetical protein